MRRQMSESRNSATLGLMSSSRMMPSGSTSCVHGSCVVAFHCSLRLFIERAQLRVLDVIVPRHDRVHYCLHCPCSRTHNPPPGKMPAMALRLSVYLSIN